MKTSMTDLLYALSFALDSVEHDLLGTTTYHAGRVALLSAEMARHLGLQGTSEVDVACVALLHDNALTEYARAEYEGGANLYARPADEKGLPLLGRHCIQGEENISNLPFYPRVTHAVLYHHENADGSGPFGKTADETPLFAQIIHIADQLDLKFDFGSAGADKYRHAMDFVESQRDRLFSSTVADAFETCVTPEALDLLTGEHPDDTIHALLPDVTRDYSPSDLVNIATIFARITDYKSSFTRRHSQGVADKAQTMARRYGLGEDMESKYYLAGALHDIGKLVISDDVLEKPARLTSEEYTYIQTHAWYTFVILRRIRGFEDITRWASLHHEKLDGSGYPFGKVGFELSQADRLMACIDIYQALTEERPYKEGLSHAAAIEIMRGLADDGKIDGSIVDDIDACFSA